ncbi:TRZ/ATZ family hydrolase [Marinimicrobium alkaliphilum]|uniref:TRZ/ATZ family hydrolase n=1 Tax=Marinimicrobium alkaliphilum TaxID=2202654 RepID=UPI000DBA1A45|nr:TRZ/ATZ family hydrolase [Marinimicrobium alkaliphilum]
MPSPEPTSLLIKARWIIPVEPAQRVFENCALAISDGVIQAVVPQREAEKRFQADTTINLGHHVLLPGLVNAHSHAAMSLLRGYADDLPLKTWLEQHIWPAESRWLSEDFVRDGTGLAMAEMVKTGTTCFADMYYFGEQVAQAAQQARMRCHVAFSVLDFATPGGSGPDDYIRKGLALRDEYRNNDLIQVGFGPHAPYTLSDEPLRKIAMLANETDTAIHIHLHETAQEVADSIAKYGMRPLERLHKLGLLTPSTQCVHMTQINDSDTQLLRDSGAHVVHCPTANLKLASGFCPVHALQSAGINVALGTGGAASNNALDMFSELRLAALLAKGVSGDATALDAHAALRMATLDGARALGLDNTIGSLEVGKSADLIAVDLSHTGAQPVHQPASQLVYTASGQHVSHAWVAGRALMLSGQLQTLNERELTGKARWWQEQMK